MKEEFKTVRQHRHESVPSLCIMVSDEEEDDIEHVQHRDME